MNDKRNIHSQQLLIILKVVRPFHFQQKTSEKFRLCDEKKTTQELKIKLSSNNQGKQKIKKE